jgi:hypothetical protein
MRIWGWTNNGFLLPLEAFPTILIDDPIVIVGPIETVLRILREVLLDLLADRNGRSPLDRREIILVFVVGEMPNGKEEQPHAEL